MFEDITIGIACILDASGTPAGTGFVVSDDGLIATCAHVLGRSRPENVSIVFQATKERREARVIPQWWRSQMVEDVAILRVEGGLPDTVQSLPLGASAGTIDHTIRTFGYPETGEVEGIRGYGQVIGPGPVTQAGQPLLQLHSNQITKGFSGAPIWDEPRRRVIGMVVIVATPDSSGRMGETAFATPMETLRAICSDLQLSEVCPYRNLDLFTEADAEFFFGRQRVIDELVNNLRSEPRFLAVFGPSGSGKSSVVQAGLIPQLRQGKVLGSDRWTVIVTRPTDPTFEQLLSLPDLSQYTRMVLVIDQFEELFRGFPEAQLESTVTQLVRLLEGHLSITIIVVMRDDFYNRFVQQEVLLPWLKRGLVNVPPLLRRDELVAMVQEPAKAIGLRFEDGLVETIVQDAIVYEPTKANKLRNEDGPVEASMQDTMEASKAQAGRGRVAYSTILPLLEFTLTKLWERREDGVLIHEVYNNIGGVTGGLTQWADQVYYGLESEEKKKARRLFTSLVYLGEEDQGLHDSRRRMSLATLSRIKAVRQIVEELASKRLLVTAHDVQSTQDMVEIIHDALLWEWRLLREWLEEDRSFLIWHQGLERRVRAWVDTNADDATRRDEFKLFGGPDLTEALRWLDKRAEDLSQIEQDFIQASRKRQKRDERRRVLIGLGMVVLVAVAGTGIWEVFSANVHPPERSLPLTSHLHGGSVNSAAWSPDGKRIASASDDKTVQVWDSASGTNTILTYQGHTNAVNSVAWSPDGKHIASAGNDTTVQVWDAATGNTLLTYQEHTDAVNSVAWSPDGKRIASASSDNTVQVWGAGITLITYRGHADFVNSVVWLPDGKCIASGSNDSNVQVWNAATGERFLSYKANAVGWSPDARHIATEDADRTVQVWDAVSGETVLTYNGHSTQGHCLAWSPDSRRIVSVSNEKEVQVLDATNGHMLFTYTGHKNLVYGVEWSPDGTRIASVGADSTVQVWDATDGSNAYIYKGHSSFTLAATWSPDSTRIASCGFDSKVRVWDARRGSTLGNTLYVYYGHRRYVWAVSWSPDGTRIASAGAYDETVRVWQAV